ncbi:MAG: PQQ-like beta-propeller repeat protein [Gemmataceae bacterium]|nr:PQQ-like beta-propeller repeat protein [Gemmataceae bacterium]
MRCVVLAALLFVADSIHAQGSDWPGFLGPLGASVSPEKGILSPWPKEGPKILWRQEVGIGYAMPSIVAGKLYHFERIGAKARLRCMNARTGEDLWSFEYPSIYRDKYGYNNGPRCCPVIDGDHVFLHGVEGMLHCVGAKDGKVVWSHDTLKDFGVVQNFFGVGSTPVIEGDLLITQIGGSPDGVDPFDDDFLKHKGNRFGIVAFEKATGKIRYTIGEELASYSAPTLATIDGRRWCFVFTRNHLVAFNPADGKVDFRFPWRADVIESVNAANPVVVGDQVLISETYGPGAALLKAKPGAYEVVWTDARKTPRNKSMQAHWMTPIHADGYVYGSSGRHETNAELRCIELATGKVMWREPGLTRTSLLMIDRHLICLGEDGMLRLLKPNPRKYELVSEVELADPKTQRPLLKSPCWAAPIVSHGRLYVRGDDRLVCLELIPAGKGKR